jgi:hypothetical protein
MRRSRVPKPSRQTFIRGPRRPVSERRIRTPKKRDRRRSPESSERLILAHPVESALGGRAQCRAGFSSMDV